MWDSIISLILNDFVPIFFMLNLFRNSKVDFRGRSTNFYKVPSSKKGVGGGRSFPLWTQSKVSPRFSLESFPRYSILKCTLWKLFLSLCANILCARHSRHSSHHHPIHPPLLFGPGSKFHHFLVWKASHSNFYITLFTTIVTEYNLKNGRLL